MTELRLGKAGGLSYVMRPGSGETVVFLHGIGSNAASFAPLFDVLPAGLLLLAWDAPGYGGSDPLAEDWPLAQDYAAKLAHFLDALGLERVHLVGHSLGTLMACAFARRFAGRVRGLTLAAAANGYGVPRCGALPEKVAARLTDLQRLGPAAFAKARAANLVHDAQAHPGIVARVETAMGQVVPDGYGQAVRMLASGDLCEDLAHISLRPSFIIGVQDRVTPMAQTQAAVRAWEVANGARPDVTEIDQAGHAVYLQQPEAFCAALLDSVARATPATPEGV